MKAKLLILALFVMIFSGCASLNGDVPFRYQRSLLSTNKTIDKNVGLNFVTDNRPDGDKAYTKNIKDISDKVTAKILDDLNSSKIFKNVDSPSQSMDDIIINPILNRFMWKSYIKGWVYIPYLDLVLEVVGVPVGTLYGVADVTFEVKDAKTGAILGTFEESSNSTTTYSIYNAPAGEAGAELSDAFRDVVKKLKEDLLTKLPNS